MAIFALDGEFYDANDFKNSIIETITILSRKQVYCQVIQIDTLQLRRHWMLTCWLLYISHILAS